MPDSNRPKIDVNERTRLLQDNTYSNEPQDDGSSQSSGGTLVDCPTLTANHRTPTGSDEEDRCDQETAAGGPARIAYSDDYIARVVLALLVGVFTASADGSLVMATHPIIASEFNSLENSSWLFISFLLAGVATQSLVRMAQMTIDITQTSNDEIQYGKLSDIYGRRSVLLTSYALFAIGSALIGIGRTMWLVIVGRVISGSGGAGIMSLAGVIITDLAPLRDVASWHSYLNVVATVGRSLGGPAGGFLADTIGWRWSFLGQTPIFLFAMVICGMILPNITTGENQVDVGSTQNRLARIDFLGAGSLGGGLLAILLPLRIAGQKVPWTSPIIVFLLALGAALLTLFVITEVRWAKEPIFPLRLLKNREVVSSYLIMVSQTAAQVGMMISVPLYFQVTERSSSTVAGAHLMPAVIGNTIGGLLTGAWIRRTGYFKGPLVFAGAISFVCYALLIFRWKGETNWAESLYIFPGGFGTGISANAAFVALQAAIDPIDKAIATSGIYLSIPIGSIIGMAACNAVMQAVVPVDMASRLRKLGVEGIEAEEIISQAIARIDYLDEAPRDIARAVSQSYVRGLEYSHGVSLFCAVLATSAAVLMRSKKLDG